MSKEQPDWQRREDAIAAAREATKDSFTVGSITVKYDSDASDTGQVWLLASCGECSATLASRGSRNRDLGTLALSLARYGCPDRGHDQKGQIESVNGVPMALGSMSLKELVELETDAQDRVAIALSDVSTIQLVREDRFPVEEADDEPA